MLEYKIINLFDVQQMGHVVGYFTGEESCIMNKLIVLLIAIVLIGCTGGSPKDKILSPTKDNSISETMPDEMPDDFGFSVSFGYDKRNEINTFNSTVTKDLIDDGTITVDIELTNAEMLEVYEKMKGIDVTGSKQFIPEPVGGEMCQQDPYEEDKWKITFDGETINHYISGEYCEPTEDARQFFELRNFLFGKIKNRDEYQELPESSGGYD